MPFQLIVLPPHEQDCLALSKREWGTECIIGRGTASQFRLPDQRRLISSRHAKITQEDDVHMLMDIGSTNGTTLNSIRLEVGKPYPLTDHDQIGIGDFTLEFTLIQAGQTVVDIEDPDATVCFQPKSMSPPEKLIEQVQAQYAEMLHLPPEDRETLLVESIREAISTVSPTTQSELLLSLEKACSVPNPLADMPYFSADSSSSENIPQGLNVHPGDLGANADIPPVAPIDVSEQEQVLNLLLEFLNDSMKGRMQFEKELDVPVTRILGKERQELKWAETPFQIRSFLFDHQTTPIPFPEKLHQLEEILQDLSLHPVGLMAGFRECVRFLLKQVDPINLEIECRNKKNDLGAKLMALGIFGNHAAWEYFKEKHRQLREEEIKTFHRLLGPELAKGYLRVYQQKMPSSQ